ncbi:phosphotransferase enzyme family protein [Paenibacillus sp. 598K]|uniref:phosphotransferase enzyme family protein n=1 Tax=Paenibacillus sp. 598K TaxID=1117987 RepID=UPI0021AAF53C|nr:phosphotransferase [Paenibacillus sp. 598K]
MHTHEALARQLLASYPLDDPALTFIRHNENLTFKVNERGSGRAFLLRVHLPVTRGFDGPQHTLEGLTGEMALLQELSSHDVITAQRPVANRYGSYVTIHRPTDRTTDVYATLLEWIEGDTFAHTEPRLDELIHMIGCELACFHRYTRASEACKGLYRPVYDTVKVDATGEILQYGVEAGIYSRVHYKLMSDVLEQVKTLMRGLDAEPGAWGLIHADLQRDNIVVTPSGQPAFLDFSLSGYGYALFDLASASTKIERDKRHLLLEGYSAILPLPQGSMQLIEGLILLDVFLCYAFFIRDAERNDWIGDHVIRKNELWRKWLSGQEIFYLL